MRIVDTPDGDGLALFVENQNLAAVTLTITVFGENAVPDRPMPVIVTCRGRGRFPVAGLKADPGATSFSYRVRYDWQFGLAGAKHEPSTVYELPFARGGRFRVDQGPGGAFTHGGNNQNAVDFGMPEGTPIHAARGGVVEVVVDRFERGGTDPAFRDDVNMILVRHPDGTYGEYVHLRRGGARVKPGQKIKPKEMIGFSGNTGYSQGPHLHFAVFTPKDGTTRETLAVRFRTADSGVVSPVEGQYYRAP